SRTNRLDRMGRALPTDRPRPGVVVARFQPLRWKSARPDCEEGAKGLTLDSAHHRLLAAINRATLSAGPRMRVRGNNVLIGSPPAVVGFCVEISLPFLL